MRRGTPDMWNQASSHQGSQDTFSLPPLLRLAVRRRTGPWDVSLSSMPASGGLAEEPQPGRLNFTRAGHTLTTTMEVHNGNAWVNEVRLGE